MPENEQKRFVLPRMLSYMLRKVGSKGQFTLPADITKSGKLMFIGSGDPTDLLFAAPVVNFFKQKYPKIHTSIIVDHENVEIAKGLMKVEKVITYKKKQLRIYKTDYIAFIRRLRGYGIGTVILLGRRFSLDRYMLAFACGARTRIGFAHPFAFPFINCEIRLSEGGYIGGKMKRIIDSIGLDTIDIPERVDLPESLLNHARQLIHFRKPEKNVLTVGIDPSRGKTRHHVIPEIIAYLANNLAGRRKVKFLVLASPWDDRLVDKFTGYLKSEIVELVPETAIDTIALLAQCDLFLSGNTNLFHFAARLGVPTIGLFTKYDSEEWIPESAENVRIFRGTRGEKLSLRDFFNQVEEVLPALNGVSI